MLDMMPDLKILLQGKNEKYNIKRYSKYSARYKHLIKGIPKL